MSEVDCKLSSEVESSLLRSEYIPEVGVVTVQLEVEVKESLRLGAVHFVDPLADPSLLVEHSPIEAEELDVCHLTCQQDQAINMNQYWIMVMLPIDLCD